MNRGLEWEAIDVARSRRLGRWVDGSDMASQLKEEQRFPQHHRGGNARVPRRGSSSANANAK